MKIIILGAGRVGSAIAKDLAQESNMTVVAVDLNQAALTQLAAEAPVVVIQANLQETDDLSTIVADSDLVISAVPGYLGFETLRSVIEAGKDVVDISFFSQDPFLLDDLAKSKGVTAVVDCGVAPGLSNIIAGRVAHLLDQTERYVCYVGGLPQVRRRPFEYKAPFSPVDVLEEYTRPARLMVDGQVVVRPALSDIELIDLPQVGTLEAFNTDGLRTLCQTLDIPFMQEKTLRYPGHAELMRVFRESGFFETTPVEVDGQMVSPLSVTSRLLFEQWRLAEGEADLTVMQVIVEGQQVGERVRYTYDLLDTYDEASRVTSMARTTGYTCAIVARQVITGLFRQPGICPPEFIGQAPGCYENLLSAYGQRNIRLSERVTKR